MVALSTLGQTQGPAPASRHLGEATSIPVIIPRFSCASPQPPSGTRLSSLELTPAPPSAEFRAAAAPAPCGPLTGASQVPVCGSLPQPSGVTHLPSSAVPGVLSLQSESFPGVPGPSLLPARLLAGAARSGLQPLTRAAAGSRSTTRRRRHPEQSAVPQAGRPGEEPGDPLP